MSDLKKETPKEQEKTPEMDIVEGLFGDEKEVVKEQPKETPKEIPKEQTKEKKEPSIDIEEIKRQAREEARTEAQKMFQESSQSFIRQQELTNFLRSEDGRNFSEYHDFIKKAANDPRFANIPISQLPAVVLKPQAYNDVLIKIKSDADKKAKDGKIGGNAPRVTQDPGSMPDFRNMTRAQFKEWEENNAKNIKVR